MSERLPRHRTRDPELDQRITALLDEVGAASNRDQLFEIIATGLGLATDDVDRLDVKIANAALKELRGAFRVFAPYRHIRKITMFGSARTLPDDPAYAQARQTAAYVAGSGWMVVTGAGPGIMAAGLEGAGRDRSFGINIRLPFEQGANEFIAGDPKLVTMKYFFTRKVMLLKESDGFVVLPGGFGTLDEALELLTLMQTGKADPSPVVFLDTPGGTYWHAFERFMSDEVLSKGLVSAEDRVLYTITDDAREATAEILGFYRNYHSRRLVGHRLVIRLQCAPTAEELAEVGEEFADICVDGTIEATPPLGPEVADDDHVELPRIALRFDRISLGRLRSLIDRLNRLSSAPPPPSIIER